MNMPSTSALPSSSQFTRVRAGEVPATATAQAYLVSPELAEAVNIALLLDRPLLVTGEPGTGKTALASALARSLDRELLEFYCKSTSVGRDVLYRFDHLGRLYDAQHPDAKEKPVSEYVNYEALGKAIIADSPKIVLIDEIDKASRDFPNDLLNEIARFSFDVPELNKLNFSHEGVHRPVVIITSNSERQLPLPFLRRCVYFHIEFPNTEALREILRLHVGDLGIADSLRDAAISRFEELRRLPGLLKLPATDELIAWTRVLHALGVTSAAVNESSLAALPGLAAVVKSVGDTKRLGR